MTNTLFILLISLLVLHEMDAIRTKEWRMFIILKNVADETAYRIFALIHLPLYFLGLWVMTQGKATTKFGLYCVIDIFLIGHAIIHYIFQNNKNNRFISGFSKILIYSMAILAIIHLSLLYL